MTSVIRLGLMALILAISIAAASYFWPVDEHVSSFTRLDWVDIYPDGAGSRVYQVNFLDGPHGTSYLQILAQADSMSVDVTGSAPGDADFVCHAVVGKCDPSDSETWTVHSKTVKLKDDFDLKIQEVEVRLPAGAGAGVATSSGYIAVDLPDIYISPDAPAEDPTDTVEIGLQVPDRFATTTWNTGRLPSSGGLSYITTWRLPIAQGGDSGPITAGGQLASQENRDERNLLLTGIFLSSAAAAALALVAEIRARRRTGAERREPGADSMETEVPRKGRARARLASSPAKSNLRWTRRPRRSRRK